MGTRSAILNVMCDAECDIRYGRCHMGYGVWYEVLCGIWYESCVTWDVGYGARLWVQVAQYYM